MNDVKGLTWKQATKALRQYGLNETKIKNENIWLLLLAQFTSPFTFLLSIAVVLSILLQYKIEVIIILIIIIVNAVTGFVQKYNSKNIFKKLERLVKNNVYVIRDGKKVSVNTSTVVPGDILVLKPGDVVSADSYVIEQNNLCINESSLTRESEDVYKQINTTKERSFVNGNIYSGSYVVSGECQAEVFSTGLECRFSKNEFKAKKALTNFEQKLKNLNSTLSIISIIAVLLIFFTNLFTKKENSLESILLFTIAITIAIIPETLRIIVNSTLTKGALILSNKKIIVKNNSAIENLGNIDIICTDAAGTLTLNKLKIDFYHTVIPKNDFLKYSYLSTVDNVDPIDKCIIKYLKEENTEDHSEFLLEEIPFSKDREFSIRKFKDFEIIKGNPEYIFNLTKNNLPIEKELIDLNYEKGLQVISLAVKDNDATKYIGSYFFFDEIKEDVSSVIEKARNLNVMLKIITEDSKEVSEFIGQKVGLIFSSAEVIEAKDLNFSSANILYLQVTKHSVFAKCNPEQKYKIIECLQTKHFLGYLGNGNNDRSSLTLANVGIVIDSATDIAKEDSKVILLSSGLNIILDAITESRTTFEKIDKCIRISLAGNLGGFFSVGLVSIFLKYLPMLPIQIFISNLITNIPLLAIPSDNIETESLRKPKDHLLSKTLLYSAVFGIISLIVEVIFFYIVRNQEINLIQTQLFALIVVCELIILFSLRTKKGIFNRSAASPKSLLIKLSIIAFVTTILLTIFGLPGEFTGIPVSSVALVGIISGVYFLFTEAIKVPVSRMLKL